MNFTVATTTANGERPRWFIAALITMRRVITPKDALRLMQTIQRQ